MTKQTEQLTKQTQNPKNDNNDASSLGSALTSGSTQSHKEARWKTLSTTVNLNGIPNSLCIHTLNTLTRGANDRRNSTGRTHRQCQTQSMLLRARQAAACRCSSPGKRCIALCTSCTAPARFSAAVCDASSARLPRVAHADSSIVGVGVQPLPRSAATVTSSPPSRDTLARQVAPPCDSAHSTPQPASSETKHRSLQQ